MNSRDQEFLAVNGVCGATGNYLMPDVTPRQVADVAQGWAPEAEHLKELRWWAKYSCEERLGLQDGDPKELTDAGWGVIFARGADSQVERALKVLLDHRREQATRRHEGYYREFTYEPGESKHEFLPRHGVAPGRPANPSKGVPYYLLIVGGPEEIPFRFQMQLDVQYAVGRVAFETPEEYACYARSVVWAERTVVRRPRKVAFWGVRKEGDRAMRLSHDHLVLPLAKSVAEFPVVVRHGWEVETVLAERATKDALGNFLGGEATPSLLFTASHGVGFPKGHPRQRARQGALVCQDWPGPKARKAAEDHYFAAADVREDAQLLGLLTFHFACYGAGTPRFDEFVHRAAGKREPRAPADFLSRLPQRLLSHRQGGALAVVGHVERVWSSSFLWPRAGEQGQVFEAMLRHLLEGHPVGSAMEQFNQSYAELAADLAEELEEIRHGKVPDERLLSRLWTAERDARNFIVLGDPAVRLPAAGEDPSVVG